MKAILLCAGFATRMYPLTHGFPKPLLPVAGRPVIDYLMNQIVGLPEIDEIHIVTNALHFDRFDLWRRRWLDRLATRNIAIEIYNDGATGEKNRLGACGDLRLVFRRAGPAAAYLVSAGDNIYLFSIADVWGRFLADNRHCLVALAEDDPQALGKSGVPIFGKAERVLGLLEKPHRPPPGWLCPPLYFLRPTAREVLEEFLKAAGPVDAPGHFIDYLCRREPVTAIRLLAKRLDIGSLAGYRRADRIMRLGPGSK